LTPTEKKLEVKRVPHTSVIDVGARYNLPGTKCWTWLYKVLHTEKFSLFSPKADNQKQAN